MSLPKLIQCRPRQRQYAQAHKEYSRNVQVRGRSIVQWRMVQTLFLHKVRSCNPWNRPQKLVCHALSLLWPKHTVLKCYRLLDHCYFCISQSISFISSHQRMFLFYPFPFFWCSNLSFSIASEKLFRRAFSVSHFYVGWFLHKLFLYVLLF